MRGDSGDRAGRPGPDADAPDLSRLDIGGADLLAALSRWAAEARVEEAARTRTRERWLRRQATEETSFAGALLDLAERGRPVLVHTAGGRRHRGLIEAIGLDFVAVATSTGAAVLLRLDSVSAVRTASGEAPAVSGRAAPLDLLFHDAVGAVADDRPRVLVVTRSADTFAGEIEAVGTDVVALRLDGDRRASVYVPLSAVAELSST